MAEEFQPESFVARRFAKFGNPAAHDPRVVLDVAREWIDQQAEKPNHIIILIGRTTPENASATKYFQAGDYAHHAQMGLMLEAMHMVRGSG